jgi:methyltransferase (TIGR00027 family)
MINVQLSGAARTALLTLRARADEQERDTPLLQDKWSAEWYRYMPKRESFSEWYNATFQLATVIRSRLIDDAAANFINAYDEPMVVELGAGLSTRYYRLGEPDCAWIEQDLPEVMRVRRKIDQDSDNHWFLGVDIMQAKDWYSLLPEADPQQTLFIAEASLMFMEEDDVQTLFDTLSEHFSGATFVFDVVNPGYVASQGDGLQDLGAPIHWAVIEKDLKNYDIKVQETAYLLTEYPERWDELDIPKNKRKKQRSGYIVIADVK